MTTTNATTSLIENSILTSIKTKLGIEPDDTDFDKDIVDDINSVFSILYQLGVGPTTSQYHIESESNQWSEFIGDEKNIYDVKTYVYMKVRLMFDPPTSSIVLNAMKDQVAELESRLNYEVDPTDDEIAEWTAATTTTTDG